MGKTAAPTNASLRWAILRRAFLASSPTPDHSSQKDTKYVSRKTACGFNLLSCHVLHGDEKEKLRASLNIEEADNLKDAYLCYELSVGRAPRLVLMGVIPSVKDLIQISRHDPIRPEEVENKSPERTFFKEFHEALVLTVKCLFNSSATSEALFFAPRRGNSLDKFLEKIDEIGLHFDVVEIYDKEVWKLHLKFLNCNNSSWPNYDKDHCYPMLVRITHQRT